MRKKSRKENPLKKVFKEDESTPSNEIFQSQAKYKPDPFLDVGMVMANKRMVSKSRTFSAICGGMLCGVLGWTGFGGILFYFVVFILASLLLGIRLEFAASPYFVSLKEVLFSGILSQLITYLLFWVLTYNLVHVY